MELGLSHLEPNPIEFYWECKNINCSNDKLVIHVPVYMYGCNGCNKPIAYGVRYCSYCECPTEFPL